MGSISYHIIPLVINSLGGGHTHTYTHTSKHTHTDYPHRINFKKPGERRPQAGMPGSIRKQVTTQLEAASYHLTSALATVTTLFGHKKHDQVSFMKIEETLLQPLSVI